MKQNEKIGLLFWISVLIVAIISSIVSWNLSSQYYTTKCPTLEVQIPTEPCEYKEGEFYFKGSCSDVHQLVLERIEKIENSCKEFVTKNLYNKLMELDLELENTSLKDFSKNLDLDIKWLINMSCAYRGK